MASHPAIQCPLCKNELSPDVQVEDHLIEDHSKQELVQYVVSEDELLDKGDASD